MEAKLTRGGSKKYMNVPSFHPSYKGEASRGESMNSKSGNSNKNPPPAAPNSRNEFTRIEGQGGRSTRPFSCFKSGQAGHRASECAKRQVDAHVTLIDEENEEEILGNSSESIYDDDRDVENEEIGPEEGESLMIYRWEN